MYLKNNNIYYGIVSARIRSAKKGIVMNGVVVLMNDMKLSNDSKFTMADVILMSGG